MEQRAHLPQAIFQGDVTMLPVGSTAAAISGLSAAKDLIPQAIRSISTIFGSSILQTTNGHGWLAAVRPRRQTRVHPAPMGPWAHPRPATPPAADLVRTNGSTVATTFGSLGAPDLTPPAP